MTDNASEIDVTARSTIGTSTATNQISSRAKKLGQLVEKGLSGLGENQIKGFLNNALLEIEGSLSDFEKDYDGELLRLERLLSSRKGKVTKALSAGLVKVQYGKGQDYYAVDYAQMYNAFFEKVLKIVKATKSQGSSAILGQIQEHIHEMIGNDSLTDDDKALMNKLIQEMQALQKERAKIKVVEVGRPPEQKVTVEVKQEVKVTTPEEAASLIKEKKATGVPITESASLHTSVIKKLEEDVARLQKEMQDADKRAEELFDAIDAGDMTVTQSEADAAEEDFQKKEHLWKKAQEDLEREKAAQKREASSGAQELTAADVIAFRQNQKEATETTKKPLSKPDVRGSVAKKGVSVSGGKQPPSEADADYVKGARERIKVLDDAYDQFLGMQSMWMSGIEQSITDMLDGVRLASQEMVFVITAEIQKNIGGKLKVIGKQIEESFGAKSTSGVASIAGKLDTINTTLTEIKNGLVRQKYIQGVKSVQKNVEDAAPQAAIAEITAEVMNRELAPIFGEVLGEQSDLNWQRYLTLEGDVRKPILDKIVGMSPGHFATGGPLMPGQTAVVGEEGPEMLVPAGRGFHVLNNKIFRAMGGMRFLKRGTVKAEQEQEPPFKASGVKWAPRYVMDIAGDIGDGIAYATAESLKDVISSEVGPEFRTAAGGFAKRINDAAFDIAKGTSIGGVSSKAADAVDLLRLKGGKAAEMVGRFAASARYAVTGGLIFAHVLRMLTATSQIYQKGMQAVGRGWGYMLDMILLPILPAFLLVSRGFIAIGNFFRANPLVAGITAIGLFTAAITAAVYAVWKIKQDMERAAAAFERFSAAMEGREYVPPEVKKGYGARAAEWAKNKWSDFRKPVEGIPLGGHGTPIFYKKEDFEPMQSGWTSGEEPIEMGSGQAIIPRMHWYNPKRPTSVGPVRKTSSYEEQYQRSAGNWATTYDEDGNPVINKVYRVKRRIRHFLTGGLVGETGPAILHTGELVIPANVVRGGVPKFADGGVFGGGGTFSDFIGPIAAQFAGITAGGTASFLTNPAVQSVLSGMRVVSATIGSVLAPIALIGGGLGAAIGMAQKGIGVLGRVFSKGTEIQVETAVNVGRAQRNLLTLMNLQLMAVVGGIVALLAAIAAIKGPGEVGFDVAKLAAGLVNGLLQKWGQFVDDLIKGSSKFIDDFVKALIGKESFLTKLFERLFGKEAGFVPALIEKLIGKESFLGKFVDDLLKGAGSLTDEIIKKLIGEEGGFVSKIVEKLVGSEGGFIPKLIEKVVSGGGKVAEVVGGITSKAGSILGKAGEFLGLGKGAPFYAKGIKPTIGYIVGDLIGGVLAQGAGAGAADSGYTGGMTGFRPDLAQGSTTTFGAGSAEFLMNFFPKLWPALTTFNLVGQYQYGKEQAEGRLPGDMSYGGYKEYRINVTAEKLAEWWDSTATSIKAVFDGMAGWWNTTWNGFTSAVSASIDGVISTITGMVDGITAAWNSAVSALTSFFTLDNLKQIVMGAVTGAGSTVSGVVGTVGGIVGDLIHFDNGGITTKEGIGMLHAAEAIVPLSSTSIGSTTNRSEQRSMQVTNYNTFEVKREDDFLLFQRFQQFMANEQRRYTL